MKAFRGALQGAVVWDPAFPYTANIALMLAGLEDLVVIPPEKRDWAMQDHGLEVKHDLRGRWDDRLSQAGFCASALKQLDAELAFPAVDVLADGWLADVQTLGSLRKTKSLSHIKKKKSVRYSP